MKKTILFRTALTSTIVTSIAVTGYSQNVAINATGNQADPSAMLDVSSTSAGVLIPRMNTIQRGNISSPAIGLQIYNTDCGELNYWNGTCWISLGSPLPIPDSISSNSSTALCGGATATYTIPKITGATSYHWTAPPGAIINSGQGTTSISVTYGSFSGNVCVVAYDQCESSPSPSCLSINITAPGTPGAITGLTSSCANATGITYSIPVVAGATSYTWSVPSGASIITGQGTNAITLNFGSSSGNISVYASNSCGNSSAQTLAVLLTGSVPATPGTISGNSSACFEATATTYSVAAVSGVTYTWSVPSGSIITGGQGTNSITVTFGVTSGYVSVYASNNCGSSGTQTLGVTVTPVPAVPGAITGTSTVCAGTTGITYSIPVVAGLTYTWSVPAGAAITSGQGTNSIAVNFGTSSGNINVTANNSCGSSPASTLAVTVNPLPSASISTNTSPVCQNVTGAVYSVTNVTGVSYAWTAQSGLTASPFNNTNSNSITISATANGTYTIMVTPTYTATGCQGPATTFSVTANPLPAAPSISINTSPVCQSVSGAVYSVTNVAGVSYAWTAQSGLTSSSFGTTNSNSINISASASGTYTIMVTPTYTATGCQGPATTFTVTANPLPAAPSISTNTSPVCQSTTGAVYSVTNVSGVSYAWTAQSGLTSSSFGTTNSNSINISASASGTYTIMATPTYSATGCQGPATTFTVTANPLPAAPSISTNTSPVCQSATGAVYSVTNVSGVSYAWAAQTGLTSSSFGTTNSNSINISVSASGTYTITVTPTYTATGCQGPSTTFSVTVNPLPAAAGSISGTNSTCPGTNGLTYSVTSITNATGYVWTYTGSGFSIASGNSTNSITANFSGSATSGILTVYGTNSGCNGTVSANYSITLSSGSHGSQTFNYSGSIVNFTVPSCVSSLTIQALGAQGGNAGSYTGGKGAMMSGTFSVTAGEQLNILVGQQGPASTNTADQGGGAGGGGTFVTTSSNSPLIVAGGGGGASNGSATVNGDNAVTSNNGDAGGGSGGAGGTGGGGGTTWQWTGWQSGTGGGGLTGNGIGNSNGSTSYGSVNQPGTAFINGGSGGIGGSLGRNGGFGGGGASGFTGAGGGGYSGGGSGNFQNSATYGGGGGGSYILSLATNQSSSAGYQTGNGQVIINW